MNSLSVLIDRFVVVLVKEGLCKKIFINSIANYLNQESKSHNEIVKHLA